ncbi:MAG TPA: hypothetical protein ENK47_06880 [Euryarchaeota archaeon]|nr:hypothetical protein [Euryarchaeota archaeon]
MVFPYCHRCKGTKDLCGLGRCPLLDRVREAVEPFRVEGTSIEGPSPPSVFVGSYGYPKLSIGPLASPTPLPMPERLEKGEFLFSRRIDEIYSIRSLLIRGKHKVNVKLSSQPGSPASEPLYEIESALPWRSRKILDSVRELALSARSVETEMLLTRDLREVRGASVDAITMPMGPSIEVKGVRVEENPKVPNPVERAVSDTDAGAVETAAELYRSGIPLEHMVRLFSVGLLGEKRRRKMVPTRWSITAVDDTISNNLKKTVLDLPPLDRYLLYSGSRFGNHFLVALFPPPFRFEMLEQWQKGSLWGAGDIITDHEGPRGRSGYASNITGAYYAARLAVLEFMERSGRCGGASVIRWITDEYWAPLGVWVIRETLRRTLGTPPVELPDMKGLVEAVNGVCGMKGWRGKSRFLSGWEDSSLNRFL